MPRATKATSDTRASATASRGVSRNAGADGAKATGKTASTSSAKSGNTRSAKATKKEPVKKARKATKKGRSATLDKFLQSQRKTLVEERETYTRQAQSLREEAEQLAQDWEPGDATFDEEGGEGDSLNVERERDLALSSQALAAIEDIDRALAKIDSGSYGICERCGEPIPRERLKAVPQAALCVQCKTGGLGRR